MNGIGIGGVMRACVMRDTWCGEGRGGEEWL